MFKNSSKGFCPKVEQEKIRKARQRFFKVVLALSGSEEVARQALADKPYTHYVPGEGYIFSAEPVKND